MKIKFRTKAACRIANVEPQRLNEAIAASAYTCAPRTTAGVSRAFDEEDLIALFVWGFLVRHLDYPLKLSSMYACEILNKLKQNYMGQEPERIDFPLNPFPDEGLPCLLEDATIFNSSGGISYATIGFNIKLLRKEIQDRMEAEAAVLGEED